MPTMHPNFWIGCLQLIHWVFLKPFVLRRYTAYLVSGLVEDFTLWEARQHILTNRKLRRLLLQAVADMTVLPITITSILLFFANIFGWQVNWSGAFIGIVACAAFGFFGAFLGAGAGQGTATGVAAGIGMNLGGGLLFAFGLGLGNVSLSQDVIATLKGGALMGIPGGMSIVVAVLLSRGRAELPLPVLGILSGSAIAGMGFGFSGTSSLFVGITVALIIGLVSTYVVERHVTLRTALLVIVGIVAGVCAGVIVGALINFKGGPFNTIINIMGGAALGICLATMLIVPKGDYNILPGIIVSAAVSLGGLIAVIQMAGIESALEAWGGYVISFVLFYFHLPYYPLELLWQLLMYYRADKHPEQSLTYTRLSPVYWDDYIWLPMPMLDRLLLTNMRNDQERGLAEINFVAQSFRQRWAASNALIEFTAEKLAHCKDIDKILELENNISWLPEDLTILGQDIAEAIPRFLSISRDVKVAVQSGSLYGRRLGLREALERLENLDRSLKLQGSQTYQRWYPAVESWQKVLLTELDTSKNPGSNEEIVVINPYVVGNPLRLNRKDLFKGRLDLRDAVAKALLERGRQTLFLHGPRRMGKTSFLLQLPALLSGKTIPVFMDLQRPAFLTDDAAFLFNVARSISRDARPYRLIIPSPNRYDFQLAPFAAFDDWLEEKALPALGEFNLLITLDEFEKLGLAISSEQLSLKLLDEIRHTIQHQEKISLLFAGVQTLEQLGPEWTSYFINVLPLRISYLNPSEAEDLIRNPDHEIEFNLNYTDDAVSKIIQETHCHPYLLQLVCFSIVELANTQKTTNVNYNLVESAISTALKQGTLYFQNIWDETAGPIGQRWLERIAQYEQPVNFDLSEKDQEVIDKLIQHSVLAEINGDFAFEVPLFKRWIIEYAPHDLTFLEKNNKQISF